MEKKYLAIRENKNGREKRSNTSKLSSWQGIGANIEVSVELLLRQEMPEGGTSDRR